MASNHANRLQDTFLERIQQHRTPLAIFLVNGVKLQGVLVAHDAFCLTLELGQHLQTIYKSAVSTLNPLQAVDLYEPAEDEAPQPRSAPRRNEPRPVVGERRRLRG